MTDAPVRVALIGCGNSGRYYHLPHLLADPRVDLRAVAAASRASLDDVALPAGVDRVAGWAEVVARDDVELVVVALPHHLHHPVARAALENGRHVLVEKPMTVTTAEADELLALADAGGLVLAVHHQRRWEADVVELGRIVRSGELGEVWRVVVVRGHQGDYVTHGATAPHAGDTPVAWVTDRRAGGGVARLIGPHPVDHLLALVGAPVVTVAGRVHRRDGEDVEDWLAVDVTFTTGTEGHLEVFRRTGVGLPRFAVWGSDGMAVAPDGTSVQVRLHDGTARVVDGLAAPGTLGREVYDDVLGAVRRGTPLRVPARHARDVVEVIELAELSAAAGGVPLRPGAAAGEPPTWTPGPSAAADRMGE